LIFSLALHFEKREVGVLEQLVEAFALA